MSRAIRARLAAAGVVASFLCGSAGARDQDLPLYHAPAGTGARAVARSMAMQSIPAGDFSMGSDEEGYQNGYPKHAVHVAAFQMGTFDVTFDQYDAFARATHRALPPDEGWGRGDRPVINVDWSQIHAFIDWLNMGSGRRFRLPSEAEWEYAARAHTLGPYWWGTDPDPEYANTAANTGRDIWEFTSPVGRFPMNPFGLYDMLGNVWQYVADCRHLTYTDAPVDGRAWISGTCDSRVVRGGYYGSLRIGMRSNTRGAAGEQFHSMALGFRLSEGDS